MIAGALVATTFGLVCVACIKIMWEEANELTRDRQRGYGKKDSRK